MNESTFTIFIIFGFIWITMATASVIALLKTDGQKIRFGKTGLIVIIPIILPIFLPLPMLHLEVHSESFIP